MNTAPIKADSLETVERAAAAEVTGVESTGRWPLLLLIGAAFAWLLVGGVLALITSVQEQVPAFFDACPLLSHGRALALQETAFVYGWIGNAGLAVVLWILGRLSGEPLRGSNWALAGALFWNVGIALALAGVATGDATGVSMLELPRYVAPLLLASYASIALAGVLAWTGRRRAQMFVAQWYAVAALFLFPWIFSVAQVMLLWAPVRGVLQAILAGWFAQGLWTLWMAPLALAGAYYVVPRATGRVLPSYDAARLGFWTLLFVGGWTGGRHLIGGPVPVWISTVAIVTSALLLVHYIIVLLNLRGAFAGGGTALRFISFGVAAYVLGGFVDAFTASHGIAAVTQFTAFDQAQQQMALYGGVSMILFGTLYFAVPRIVGRPWASTFLVQGHLALAMLGVALLVISLAVAGWIQGNDLNDANIPFGSIAGHMAPSLMAAAAAQAILLMGNVLLAANFIETLACRCPAGVEDRTT